MLQHLVHFDPDTAPGEFTPIEDVNSGELLGAQVKTADWLQEAGASPDEEIDALLDKKAARKAFAALAIPTDAEGKSYEVSAKAALLAMKAPAAVRHLTGMLSAYDWEFVEHAKELRGYVVSSILEETKHPDGKIRLRALEMLGKVTEVALFTERVEIKKTDMTDHELDAKIKEKLLALRKLGAPVSQPIEDITPIENTPETPEQ